MGPMQGANADELDRLAGELSQSSKLVGGCQAHLSREIHSSPWAGRGAEAFRRQWDSEFRRSLIDASAFLQEAGDVLRLNADQQRQASGTGTGPGGVPFGGPFDFGGIFGDPSFLDDWLDQDWLAILGGVYDAFGIISDLVTLLGKELLPFLGDIGGAFAGFATGAYSMWQGMDDLLSFEFDGWLGVLDSVGDGLQVVSGGLAIAGAWMMIPPVSPAGAVVLGVAAGLSIVSTGINYGIEYREELGAAWDVTTEWAGDAWESTSDWAGDTWDSATDVAGDTWSTTADAVDDGWDTATGWVGSAWNAAF